MPLCTSDSTHHSAQNLAPLTGGAQSGWDVASHTVYEDREKSRRETHSAGTTYHRNALNLPRPAGTNGVISGIVSGFMAFFILMTNIVTFCGCIISV